MTSTELPEPQSVYDRRSLSLVLREEETNFGLAQLSHESVSIFRPRLSTCEQGAGHHVVLARFFTFKDDARSTGRKRVRNVARSFRTPVGYGTSHTLPFKQIVH